MKEFFHITKSVTALLLLAAGLTACDRAQADSWTDDARGVSLLPVEHTAEHAASDAGAAGEDANLAEAESADAAEQDGQDAQAESGVSGQSETGGDSAVGTDASGGGSTAGASVEDNLLSTQVKAALLADPEVQDNNIRVEADQGDITLTGSVQNDSQIEEALRVVREVEGVRNVQNNLKVGN